MTEVRGSARAYKVLQVNYTLGMKTGVSPPLIYYKHMEVGFGGRGKVKGKREN